MKEDDRIIIYSDNLKPITTFLIKLKIFEFAATWNIPREEFEAIGTMRASTAHFIDDSRYKKITIVPKELGYLIIESLFNWRS